MDIGNILIFSVALPLGAFLATAEVWGYLARHHLKISPHWPIFGLIWGIIYHCLIYVLLLDAGINEAVAFAHVIILMLPIWHWIILASLLGLDNWVSAIDYFVGAIGWGLNGLIGGSILQLIEHVWSTRTDFDGGMRRWL